MAKKDSTPNPRQLGVQVRQLRQQAGMTQRDLADKIGVHHTMLGKIELGRRSPQLEHTEALDAVLETNGTLTRLWQELNNQRYVPDWFKNVLLLERRAIEIRYYQPMVIPGPLQAEDYARAMVREIYAKPDTAEVERVVRTRVGRLPAIAKEGRAEMISYVIRETVLTDVMGDEAIMREQLGHILERVEEYGPEVQLLPASLRRGIKGHPAFQILTLDSSRTVVVAEHAEGGMVIDNPDTVRRMMTRYGQLQSEALSPAESIRRIQQIMETHYGNVA